MFNFVSAVDNNSNLVTYFYKLLNNNISITDTKIMILINIILHCFYYYNNKVHILKNSVSYTKHNEILQSASLQPAPDKPFSKSGSKTQLTGGHTSMYQHTRVRNETGTAAYDDGRICQILAGDREIDRERK